MQLTEKHELQLASMHKEALAKEDYETCNLIQKEIDYRIANNTIDHDLMNGFRYWNAQTKQFEGKPTYKNLNGLFKNYQHATN